MLKQIARRFPRLKDHLRPYVKAHRLLAAIRPAHFHPLRGQGVTPPGPFVDRAAPDIDAINRSSEAYFQKQENRAFWLNRPFSDPASAPRILSRFGQLLSALRPGPSDRILDFGCGTGWTSVMLGRMGAEVVGMDIAPAALEIAKQVADREMGEGRSRVRFEVYGGDAIAAADEEFDFVVVNDAFHHFPNPQRLLGEFHRVLTKYGMFGFSEPGIGHATTAHSQAERVQGVLEEDVDLEQLYRSGREAGFDDLEVLIPPLEPEALTLPMERARAFLRGVPVVVPTDLLRLAILTGPIGVFRKGPHRVTSLHPRLNAARIAPERAEVTVRPGATFEIAAVVTNPSETVWLREGRRGIGYVRLGAHLMDGAGHQKDLDYGRAALPHDILAGASARIALSLVAPRSPGRYDVQLDMVNEGICWFAQQGSPVADVRLEVRD